LTTPVRAHGKCGRLPGQIPAGLRDLTHYAAGPLPKAPASVTVPAVADWGILGNQTYGDCGVAGLEHGFEAAAASTGEQEAFPGEQQCIDYYLAYTDGQDSGVVLSQYLAYVRRNGFYGHTVGAYAPVAVNDVPTLMFATWAYDFTYLGISVTQAMLDAFDAGQPWTTATLAGPVLGGHCVPAVGYDDQYLTVITWGQPQQIAWPAWHGMAEEAWCVLTGELASAGTDGHGLNLAALQADLSRLAEAKAAPVDHKGLLEELAGFLRDCVSSGRNDTTEALAWLASHGL
jgi:hypothetical protein